MTVTPGFEILASIASGGYYVALRVGFAFPMEEVNALPPAWVEHYTIHRYMMSDPVIRWVYSNTGSIRWSEIDTDDPKQVLRQARMFGLRYGLAVAVFDGNKAGQRSFGSFVRPDREFDDDEISIIASELERLHNSKAPPTNLTAAEIEALRMVKDGLRLKQIAHVLGISEGAVKQRLKNARIKLGAKTGAEAMSLASSFSLI
ncbi:MAG: LuxR family transcriptional regulator [Rubellimicrobium sp.]|nr:LuxR family transcriptional regulator [Rubellimicrobium sp.]